MLGKKNQQKTSEQSISDKKPNYSLTDFSTIKDWQKFGINRTLSNLKLKVAMDMKEAELEEKYKNRGRDWNQIMMFVVVAVVVGVIAFVMITQFMNYQDVAKENSVALKKIGILEGSLAACQNELKSFKEKTETPHEILPV